MIFYFSGTGNSAWAARQLARLTGDEACDITTLTQVPDLKACQQIGFVFPVYAWGVPEAMAALQSGCKGPGPLLSAFAPAAARPGLP